MPAETQITIDIQGAGSDDGTTVLKTTDAEMRRMLVRDVRKLAEKYKVLPLVRVVR